MIALPLNTLILLDDIEEQSYQPLRIDRPFRCILLHSHAAALGVYESLSLRKLLEQLGARGHFFH